MNSYPHVLLTEARDFPLSALSKTWIFLCLCDHLGLRAYATLSPRTEALVCVVNTTKDDQAPHFVSFASDASFDRTHDLPVLKSILDLTGHLRALTVRWFFLQSVKETTANFVRYNEDVILEVPDNPTDRVLFASHAALCALATTTTLSANTFVTFSENMAEYLPLDVHVVILDALLSKASGSAPMVSNVHVEAIEQLAQQLEDVDKLVKRQAQFSGSGLSAIGKVVTTKPHQAVRGVIVGWVVGGPIVVGRSRTHSLICNQRPQANGIVLHMIGFPHGIEYCAFPAKYVRLD